MGPPWNGLPSQNLVSCQCHNRPLADKHLPPYTYPHQYTMDPHHVDYERASLDLCIHHSTLYSTLRTSCDRLNVEKYGESVSMNHSRPYEEVHIARHLEAYFPVLVEFVYGESACMRCQARWWKKV